MNKTGIKKISLIKKILNYFKPKPKFKIGDVIVLDSYIYEIMNVFPPHRMYEYKVIGKMDNKLGRYIPLIPPTFVKNVNIEVLDSKLLKEKK